MRDFPLGIAFLASVSTVSLIAACGGDGSAPRDGGGGNSPTSGSTGFPTSGSSTGATAGRVSIGLPTGGAGGREAGCNELTIVPEPITPTVMVLVDNSSSMFEPRDVLWDRLYTALMDPTDGVLKPLESKIRFGFASYRGSTSSVMETDPKCAEIRDVDFALDNHGAIDTLYKQLGTEWMQGVKWETPTGHAINRIVAELAAYNPTPAGPKYILLVTDGDPNTCQVVDPQCGQDLSIKAVQDAKAKDISTLVVGIGNIVSNNSGCEPRWGRCGPDHLQDLANAGLGLGVATPPAEFVYQSCASQYGQMLQATYSATPGTAPFYTATSAEELKSSLTGLLSGVLSCTVDMNALVTGDESLGRVTVGGQQVPFNDPNGWKLEANDYSVTLQGTACERFKTLTPGEKLDIWFPCGVAVVR